MNQFDRIEDMLKDLITKNEPTTGLDPAWVREQVKFMFKSIIANRKIESIKAYRALTGSTLIDSKNAVEDLINCVRGTAL